MSARRASNCSREKAEFATGVTTEQPNSAKEAAIVPLGEGIDGLRLGTEKASNNGRTEEGRHT